MVNGIVVISSTFVTVLVISSTFVAVLVIFIYLCEFMDSRSRCDYVGPHFALRLFFDDPSNDFLQLVLGDVLN